MIGQQSTGGGLNGTPAAQPAAPVAAQTAPQPVQQMAPQAQAVAPQAPAPVAQGNPYAPTPMNFGMGNPYLQDQANELARVSNQNLQTGILPSINSGAMAAGGYGGSRQGIAQGLAIQGQQNSLNGAMANLYGNAYASDRSLQNQFNIAGMQDATAQRGQTMNFDLGKLQNTTTQRGQDLNYTLGNRQVDTTQRGQDLNFDLGKLQNTTAMRGQDLNYGATTRGQDFNLASNLMQNQTANRGQDLNYNLGMTNAGNTAQGQLMNFYTGNRQLDQSGMQLGMNMFNNANQGTLAQGQGIYNTGTTAQNAAWSPYTQFGGITSPYTGFGTTTQTQDGSNAAGFAGGALMGSQLYNMYNQPAKQGA
ncbi:MAG: hypothetical protein RL323_1760 [Pseudomonadota bacterium]